MLIFGLIIAIHLVPYFLLQGSKSDSYSELVPVNYSIITNTGASPSIFASSIQTSSVEKFLFGSYGPRLNIEFAVFSLVLTMFAFVSIALVRSAVVTSIAVLYAIAFIFALGVYGAYDFLIRGMEIPIVGSVFGLIVEVLRQPSRWQFIELFAKMVLFSVTAALTINHVQKARHNLRNVKTIAAVGLLSTAIFLPFLISDYSVVFSGDFGKSIKPVVIPTQLQEIKKVISDNQRPYDKLIVLNPAIPKLDWNENGVLVQESFYS
jgi:hypothetical protein